MFPAQCMLLIKWSGWDVNGMDLIATNWPNLTHHSHKLNFKKADGCFVSGNRIMCQLSFLFHSWAWWNSSLPTGFVHISLSLQFSAKLKNPHYSHTGFLKQPGQCILTISLLHAGSWTQQQQPHRLAELFLLREPVSKPKPNLHTAPPFSLLPCSICSLALKQLIPVINTHLLAVLTWLGFPSRTILKGLELSSATTWMLVDPLSHTALLRHQAPQPAHRASALVPASTALPTAVIAKCNNV